MKTQLETAAGLTATDLFLNGSAQDRIDAIRTEALAEVFDVTTDAGRKACISQAAKVTKTKTAVDKVGKALVEPLKADAKKVDADRKLYRDGLDAIKTEVRRPVTEWEEAEAAKAAKIAQAFSDLETNSEAHNFTGELFSMAVLEAKLERLETLEVADFGDEAAKAQELIFAGKTKIRAAIQQRKDADELAELRRAKEAQDAADEKARRDKEIADKAIADHEAAKADESMLRTPENEAYVSPADRAEANKAPSKMPWLDESPKQNTALAINAAFIDDLVEFGGVDAGQARLILEAIKDGRIRNVSINY